MSREIIALAFDALQTQLSTLFFRKYKIDILTYTYKNMDYVLIYNRLISKLNLKFIIQ